MACTPFIAIHIAPAPEKSLCRPGQTPADSTRMRRPVSRRPQKKSRYSAPPAARQKRMMRPAVACGRSIRAAQMTTRADGNALAPTTAPLSA